MWEKKQMEQKWIHSNLSAGENGHLFFAGMDTVALGKNMGRRFSSSMTSGCASAAGNIRLP